MEKIFKRLCVIDLDGCLLDTPHPETGKPEWEKHYNKKFPYTGWWGRKESLDTEVFNIKPFPNVLAQLNKENNTPDTRVIILTSRREKLRPEIENVLKLNGIVVDDVILKRGNEGKGDVILRIESYNQDLKEIVVYDDFMDKNPEKIAEYTKIEDQLPDDVIYTLYFVDQGNISLFEGEGIVSFESTKKILDIIQEEIKKIN